MSILNELSIEEGYRLAKYQTPGYRIYMGLNKAYKRKIEKSDKVHTLKSYSSFEEYQLKSKLNQTQISIVKILNHIKHEITEEERRWILKNPDRDKIIDWLNSLKEKEYEHTK